MASRDATAADSGAAGGRPALARVMAAEAAAGLGCARGGDGRDPQGLLGPWRENAAVERGLAAAEGRAVAQPCPMKEAAAAIDGAKARR